MIWEVKVGYDCIYTSKVTIWHSDVEKVFKSFLKWKRNTLRKRFFFVALKKLGEINLLHHIIMLDVTLPVQAGRFHPRG